MPTATATIAVASATPAFLPTATPSGGVGPALVPPGTGDGSTGGSFPWALALFAAAAAASVLAGGLYLGLNRMRSGDR